jgi:hypothetical protein
VRLIVVGWISAFAARVLAVIPECARAAAKRGFFLRDMVHLHIRVIPKQKGHTAAKVLHFSPYTQLRYHVKVRHEVRRFPLVLAGWRSLAGLLLFPDFQVRAHANQCTVFLAVPCEKMIT